MFLDNEMQIAEKDAHLYNKQMLLPFGNKNLNQVLILGCGDGGILKDLLHLNPKKITLVDIDKEVINISKKYLSRICGKAFDNKKVHIKIDDAFTFVKKHKDYDAIIYDLTNHPEEYLKVDPETFLASVFGDISQALKREGILSMQVSSEYDIQTIKIVKKVLNKYFKNIQYSSLFIPSFSEPWVFATGVKK